MLCRDRPRRHQGAEYTRSLSRNGFSQVTAVFAETLDIYFARQQVAERLAQVRRALPPGQSPPWARSPRASARSTCGRSTTRSPAALHQPLAWAPGWQPDGSHLTPEGQRLRTALEQTAYLRTVQDWIIRPQIKTVPGVAGVDGIGGFEKQYHVQLRPR